jgi:hypothetical protein
MTETLTIQEMLPGKFNLKQVNRFVIEIEPFTIDRFLFCSLERDQSSKRLIANVYDAVAPSSEMQLVNWMKSQTLLNRILGRCDRTLTLKVVDGIGQVLSKTVYTGVRLKSFKLPFLDYDAKGRTGNESRIEFVMTYANETHK